MGNRKGNSGSTRKTLRPDPEDPSSKANPTSSGSTEGKPRQLEGSPTLNKEAPEGTTIEAAPKNEDKEPLKEGNPSHEGPNKPESSGGDLHTSKRPESQAEPPKSADGPGNTKSPSKRPSEDTPKTTEPGPGKPSNPKSADKMPDKNEPTPPAKGSTKGGTGGTMPPPTKAPLPSHPPRLEPPRSGPLVKKIFHVYANNVKGELYVTGNVPELGNWSPLIPMISQGRNYYRSPELEIAVPAELLYKFVQVQKPGILGWLGAQEKIEWEGDRNHQATDTQIHEFRVARSPFSHGWSKDGEVVLFNSIFEMPSSERVQDDDDFLDKFDAFKRSMGDSYEVGQHLKDNFKTWPSSWAVIALASSRLTHVHNWVPREHLVQGALKVVANPIFHRHIANVAALVEKVTVVTYHESYSWLPLLASPLLLGDKDLRLDPSRSPSSTSGWQEHLNKLVDHLTEQSNVVQIAKTLISVCHLSIPLVVILFRVLGKFYGITDSEEVRLLISAKFERLLESGISLQEAAGISEQFPEVFREQFGKCFAGPSLGKMFDRSTESLGLKNLLLNDPRFRVLTVVDCLLPKVASLPYFDDYLCIALHQKIADTKAKDAVTRFLLAEFSMSTAGSKFVKNPSLLFDTLDKVLKFRSVTEFKTSNLFQHSVEQVTQIAKSVPAEALLGCYREIISANPVILDIYRSIAESQLHPFKGDIVEVEKAISILHCKQTKLPGHFAFKGNDEPFVRLSVLLLDSLSSKELPLALVLTQSQFWISLLKEGKGYLKGSKTVSQVFSVLGSTCDQLTSGKMTVREFTELRPHSARVIALSKLQGSPVSESTFEDWGTLLRSRESERQCLDQFFIYCQRATDDAQGLSEDLATVSRSFQDRTLELVQAHSFWGKMASFLTIAKDMRDLGRLSSFERLFVSELSKHSEASISLLNETVIPAVLATHRKRMTSFLSQGNCTLADCDVLFQEASEADIMTALKVSAQVYQHQAPQNLSLERLLHVYASAKVSSDRGRNLQKFLGLFGVSDIDAVGGRLERVDQCLEDRTHTLTQLEAGVTDLFAITSPLGERAWEILGELAAGKDLLRFLQANLAADFRVLIDAVEEHSDQLIRAETVSDLISVARLLKVLLDLPQGQRQVSGVVAQLGDIARNALDTDVLKLRDCNTNIHGLERLYQNLANRGEVTKEIIHNALEKGSFVFTLLDGFDLDVSLQYDAGKGPSRYSLTQLGDLRSRALLIANTEKVMTRAHDPAVDPEGPKVGQDMKPRMKRFVTMVDLVQEISDTCEVLRSQGTGFESLFPMTLTEEELEPMRETLVRRSLEWGDILDKCRQDHYFLNFFTPSQLWTLYNLLVLPPSERQTNQESLETGFDLLSQCDRNIHIDDVAQFPKIQGLPETRIAERLEVLGQALTTMLSPKQVLARPFPALSSRLLADGIEAGKLRVAVVANDRLISNVLLSFYSHTGHLPLPSQILFCGPSTDWSQINLLLQRCFLPGSSPGIYCLVGVDKLEFLHQNLLVHAIQQQLSSTQDVKWKLLVVTQRGRFAEQFRNSCQDCHGFSTDISSGIIRNICRDSCCVISRTAGLGKSEFIRHRAAEMGKTVKAFPVNGDLREDLLVSMLTELRLTEGQALHLNIGSVSDPSLLNSLLFQLLVVGSVRSNAEIFRYLDRKAQIPATFLEIANTLNNHLVDSLPFCRMLRGVDLAWDLGKLIASSNPRSHIQVVCNYFRAVDNGTLGTENITFQGPHSNSLVLDSAECQALLRRHFFDHFANNQMLLDGMNFNVLNTFIRVFAEQLWSFSESAFFRVERLKLMTEHPQEVRTALFRNLKEVAADFATRSVAIVRGSQHQNLLDGVVSSLENITNWYNKKYLVIAFQSQTRQTISALYRAASVVPKEVAQLLRTQANAGQSQTWNLDEYREMAPEELLLRLERLVRTSNKALTYPAYSLTADNLLKMALIILRVRANIPVIIMGETGCGKTSLIKFLAGAAEVEFRCLNLHAGVTETQVLHFVQACEAVARENGSVWAFFDEINACELLGLLNEIICDRRVLGRLLHPGVRVLAACNPYRRAPPDPLDPSGLIHQNLEGIRQKSQSNNEPKLVYRVHPLPETMLDYVWDYGTLTEEEEKEYIRKMVEELNLQQHGLGLSHQQLTSLTESLVTSQNFIREIEGNYSVSLRDVKRCIELIGWFWKHLMEPASLNHKRFFPKTKAWFSRGVPDSQIPPSEQRAIVLGLAHCYQSRLSRSSDRQRYRERIAPNFRSKDPFEAGTFEAIVKAEQDAYLSKMELPPGTAKNSALLENVFVLLVCILNKIPIFLVGKPGCSKSLSMQLIRATLRGPDSKDPFFQKLPQVYVVSFQGSESSTSEGILNIFEKANSYQEKNQEKVISVVLLDEIGLAEISPNNPLKVLHSLLEPDFPNTRPNVAVVGISNWALDAAKMNRAIHLSRPEPDAKDLLETGLAIQEGCSKRHPDRARLKSIADAYFDHYETQVPKNFHGLRDYYSLVKAISQHESDSLHDNDFLRLIDRNFGGLPSKRADIRATFMRTHSYSGATPDYLGLVNENIKDQSARHLMVISKGDTGLRILERSLREKGITPVIIFGSRFENDRNDEYNYRILSRIILCMEVGEVVILKDLDRIYGGLYDMLNQNYTYVGSKRNCRIALGANSNPMCHVHENFRCVVLMEESELLKADPPFLNRFEKQHLTYSHLFDEERKEGLRKALADWAKAISTVETKVDGQTRTVSFNEPAMFAGFNQHTISSLILKHHDEDAAQLSDAEILKKCKADLILTASADAILRSEMSDLVFSQREEVQYWKEVYQLEAPKRSFTSLLEETSPHGADRLLITTFSSIHENLEEILEERGVTATSLKLGGLKSEKELVGHLQEFFAEERRRLFILQFDPEADANHVAMAKFTLDRIRDNYPAASAKRVVMVAHLHRSPTESNSKWPFDFMSGWKPIMVDSVRPEGGDLAILLQPRITDVLRSVDFSFETVLHQTLLWCFSCIKYEAKEEEVTRIQDLKSRILQSPGLVALLRDTVLEILHQLHEPDWQMRIACDPKRLFHFGTLASALRQYVKEVVMQPLAKIIFLLEKTSALEAFFQATPQQPEMLELWTQGFHRYIRPEIGKIPEPKGLECYQLPADACLPLVLPFSLPKWRAVEEHRRVFMTELKQAAEGDDDFETDEYVATNRESVELRFEGELGPFGAHLGDYFTDFIRLQKLETPLIPVNVVRWLIENQRVVPDLSKAVDLHLTWWINRDVITAQLRLITSLTASPNFKHLTELVVPQAKDQFGKALFDFLCGSLFPAEADLRSAGDFGQWLRRLNSVLSMVHAARCLDSPAVHFLRVMNDLASEVLLPALSRQTDRVGERKILGQLASLSAVARDSGYLLDDQAFSVIVGAVTSLAKADPALKPECECFLGSFLRRSVDQQALTELNEHAVESILDLLTSSEFDLRGKASPLFMKLLSSLDSDDLLDLLDDPQAIEEGSILFTIDTWLGSLPQKHQHPLAVLMCDFLQDLGKLDGADDDHFLAALRLLEATNPSPLQLITAVAVFKSQVDDRVAPSGTTEQDWATSRDAFLNEMGAHLKGTHPRTRALKLYVLKALRQQGALSIAQLRQLVQGYPWLASLPWARERTNLPYDPFCFDLQTRARTDDAVVSMLAGRENSAEMRALLNGSPSDRLSLLGSVFSKLHYPRVERELGTTETRVCQDILALAQGMQPPLPVAFSRALTLLLTNSLFDYNHLTIDPEDPEDIHFKGVLIHLFSLLACAPPSRDTTCPLLQVFRRPGEIPTSYLIAQPSNEHAMVFRALQASTEGTAVSRYSCINGHMYIIANCGQPMQTSVCPECNVPIGGTDHQPVATTRKIDASPNPQFEGDSPSYCVEEPDSIASVAHTVRELRPTSFRILHFLLHCAMVLSWVTSADTENDGKRALTALVKKDKPLGFLMQHARKDWDVLLAQLNLTPEDLAICLHEVLQRFYSLPPFPQAGPWSSPALRNAWESTFTNLCVQPVFFNPALPLTTSVHNFKRRSQEVSKEEPKLENEIGELNIDETRRNGAYCDQALVHLLRIRKPKTLETLLSRFSAQQENAERFPFLAYLLRSFEALEQIALLKPILQWVHLLQGHYSHKLSREQARATIRDLLDEKKDDLQFSEMYQEFEKAWNQIRKAVDSYECKALPNGPPEMSSEVAVIFSLLEPENEGIYLCAILDHLGGLQNDFLKECITLSGSGCTSLRFLQQSDTQGAVKQVRIMAAKENQVLSNAWNETVLLYGFSTPEYGHGSEIQFDFPRIEAELAILTLLNKASLETKALNPFPFHCEVFHGCYEILAEVRERVPQEELGAETLNSYRDREDIRGKASELLATLNVIITFVKRTGASKDQTIEDYCAHRFKDETCKPLLDTSLGKLCLGNLVSVYEMIEEIQNDKAADFTHDRYKESLPAELRQELFACLQDIDLSKLLTCLKRFLFRMLAVDKLDPEDPLRERMFSGTCWPGPPVEAQKMEALFSRNLKVKHASQACKALQEEEEKRIHHAKAKEDDTRALTAQHRIAKVREKPKTSKSKSQMHSAS